MIFSSSDPLKAARQLVPIGLKGKSKSTNFGTGLDKGPEITQEDYSKLFKNPFKKRDRATTPETPVISTAQVGEGSDSSNSESSPKSATARKNKNRSLSVTQDESPGVVRRANAPTAAGSRPMSMMETSATAGDEIGSVVRKRSLRAPTGVRPTSLVQPIEEGDYMDTPTQRKESPSPASSTSSAISKFANMIRRGGRRAGADTSSMIIDDEGGVVKSEPPTPMDDSSPEKDASKKRPKATASSATVSRSKSTSDLNKDGSVDMAPKKKQKKEEEASKEKPSLKKALSKSSLRPEISAPQPAVPRPAEPAKAVEKEEEEEEKEEEDQKDKSTMNPSGSSLRRGKSLKKRSKSVIILSFFRNPYLVSLTPSFSLSSFYFLLLALGWRSVQRRRRRPKRST